MQIKTSSELDSAIRSFLLDREARHCSPFTLSWYRRYLTILSDWLTEHDLTDPAQVTASHVRLYIVELQHKNLSARTVHHHASAARAFFNFCVAEDLISISPMTRIKMPRLPKDILPAFSEADVRSILKACETDRDTAIVLVLLDTGVRLREFISLRVADIDLTTGKLTVRLGKGQKDRVTFLGEKTRKALRRYLSSRTLLESQTPLWLTEQGQRALSAPGLQHILARLKERSGVAHCHAHTFRRTFALASLRAGMDLVSLQRIMGHADVKILEKYLAQDENDLRLAHQQHGAVDALLSKR